MKLVRKILKVATVLKTMRIIVDPTLDSEAKLRSRERISKFRRRAFYFLTLP